VAPVIVFVAVFSGFAAIPLGPDWIGVASKVGVFYLLAIISVDVVGFLLAGWASNNKYSLFGAMRAVAQLFAYEVPLTLSVLCIVLYNGSLDLSFIVSEQTITAANPAYLFGIKYDALLMNDVGGILTWNIIQFPISIVALVVFFITSLAETNRGPFDVPEAESEIVAGFQTEYSGFRWSAIMLGEYAMMLLVAFLGISLFLGGWSSPLPNMGSVKLYDWTSGTAGSTGALVWSYSWLLLKAFVWVFVQMWVRWTYPRLRVDQLMYMCWKVLIPLSLVVLLIATVWKLFLVS
jgi:NADH-quinone oxidoreductase subunit H